MIAHSGVRFGVVTGSLITNPSSMVPTVTDTAQKLGLLDDYVVGISFEPLNPASMNNGQLTFGGVDHSKFDGILNYT